VGRRGRQLGLCGLVEKDASLGQEDVQVAGEKTLITRAGHCLAYWKAASSRKINARRLETVQDMVAIRNQMLGLLGAVPTIFGDLNGDGKVDISDYTLVRTLIGTHL
jgi:hypothetical protein